MRIRCGNPCGITQTNTAACESLPSQISNFTLQFFGTVVKTEVDGVVDWSLPCGLDVGLPNNPRADGEGLACYFLRLFNDGIIGLTGPQGAAGANGANGLNAYTVTLQSFTQPSTGSPNTQVLTSYNPAILDGMNVFIEDSGWYEVTTNDVTGTLFVTLKQAVPGASAGNVIPVGRLVVPAGFQGNSIVGPTGPQGPAGPQGATGSTPSATNGFYFTNDGGATNYPVTAAYAAVGFTTSSPAVILPSAGTYLLTVTVAFKGLGAIVAADTFEAKLFNGTTAADVSGSEKITNTITVDQLSNLSINVIVTTATANNTISLYARASGGSIFEVTANKTTLSYVRLA